MLARLSGGRNPDRPASANPSVPRLVVVNDGATGTGARVELVHEALIHRWETLRRWIGEERKALELRDDVEEAARLWEASGATVDSLPKGGMLERFRKVERAGLREGARRFVAAAEEAERQAEAARDAPRKSRWWKR